MDWNIRETGFEKEQITQQENRFFCGNGYLGIRGALEEYGKEEMPAVNLAGIFDQVGEGWREPVNAPNGLYTRLRAKGALLALPEREPSEHRLELDFRHGVFSRRTCWEETGGKVTVETERFASMEKLHLIGLRYRVRVDFACELQIDTGIDGEVWDIHGPHYRSLQMECRPGQTRNEQSAACLEGMQQTDFLYLEGTTQELGERVAVQTCGLHDFNCVPTLLREPGRLLHRFSFLAEPGRTYTLEKAIAVYTSKDREAAELEPQGRSILEAFMEHGYQQEKQLHVQSWEKKWRVSQVELEGDEEAEKALNYSIYHLLSIAPDPASGLSIPARGLSGQTYKGAVFWDTELFMLDFFLFTDPAVARSLVRYRIDTLEGAQKKAKEYGYEGAFYAWESQEGGRDACTDYNVTDVFTGRPMRTYFRDRQYHISAAVVYGIWRYLEVTGDESLLCEGGRETVAECARFYYSLLVKRAGRSRYEIWDAIGPDEYHERVRNNAYTNRMAKFVLEYAASLLDGAEAERFLQAAALLYIPQPDKNGIIPQFDGYEKLEDASVEQVRSRLLDPREYWGGAYGVAAETKVIKQADVVTLLNLFPEEYTEEIKKKNWDYYEPRTEHGSSLSACMYALLACRCHRPDLACPFFEKTARADLWGGGKEWAGLVYIGGTHPAAAGGAYMTAVEGFGGLRIRNGMLEAEPTLPKHWNRLCFSVCFRGDWYRIEIIREQGTEKDQSCRESVRTLFRSISFTGRITPGGSGFSPSSSCSI